MNKEFSENIITSAMVTVASEQEMLDAIADTTVETIMILGTIEITETVLVDRPLHITGGKLRVSNAVMRTPWHQPSTVLAPYLASAWPNQTSAILRIESEATISNITITGPATTTTRTHVSGIYITNASGPVKLQNVTINYMHHGNPDGVMDAMGGFGVVTRNSNVEIYNSHIENFNNQGIQQVGRNLLVQNTTIIGSAQNHHLRAKSGIQISPGSVSTTLIGNTISDFRFTADGAVSSGVLIFDGTITAKGNTFNNTDVGIIASGSWGNPNVTLSDTSFNDATALDTDVFIRIEGGDGGNGVHATITNHNAIWADRVSFPFGGGIYNNALVTTPGNAADQKNEGTLRDISPSIITFYYPSDFGEGTLQLQLSNIMGNRIADRLVVWAAADGYIREFPTSASPGHIVYGWRDFAHAGEHAQRLPEPLFVKELKTVTPITRTNTHTVNFIVENGGISVGTTTIHVNHGEMIPSISIPGTAAKTGWRFLRWKPFDPTNHGSVTSNLVFTAIFEPNESTNNVQPPFDSPTPPPSDNYQLSIPSSGHELSVQTRLSDDNATATLLLSAANVNDFIHTHTNDIVYFDLTALYDVTTVVIPRAALRSFSSANLAIEFKMPQATVIFDAIALQSLGQQANNANVSLMVAEVDLNSLPRNQLATLSHSDVTLYKVNVQSGNQELTNFDGEITVSMPWINEQPASVWLLSSDDGLEPLSVQIDTGQLLFTTNELGIFAIGYKDKAEVRPETSIPHIIRFSMNNNLFTINGLTNANDVAPFLDTTYGRVMIPLRAVSEALGEKVDWVHETRTVLIFTAAGPRKLAIDTPLPGGMGIPILKQDRVFVPLGFVTELLGVRVRWDDANMAAYIYR